MAGHYDRLFNHLHVESICIGLTTMASSVTENQTDLSVKEDLNLASEDPDHLIYLCEYGLVHIHWGAHRLVYCPGDFVGLPYLLAALDDPCDLECAIGDTCPRDHGDGVILLQYGSVQLPFERSDCQRFHLCVRQAVGKLEKALTNGELT
jgi:hypothetical protein